MTRPGCGRQWTLGQFLFINKNIFKNLKSDPDEPNGKYEQFCIKFKNAEIAADFKNKFEEAQNALVDTGNFTPDRDVSGGYFTASTLLSNQKLLVTIYFRLQFEHSKIDKKKAHDYIYDYPYMIRLGV